MGDLIGVFWQGERRAAGVPVVWLYARTEGGVAGLPDGWEAWRKGNNAGQVPILWLGGTRACRGCTLTNWPPIEWG